MHNARMVSTAYKSIQMKSSAISVRVSEEVKRAIEKAAAADNRSVASLVDKLVQDFLRKHGLLRK